VCERSHHCDREMRFSRNIIDQSINQFIHGIHIKYFYSQDFPTSNTGKIGQLNYPKSNNIFLISIEKAMIVNKWIILINRMRCI